MLSKPPHTMRIITRTFQVPESSSTRLQSAIAKILTNIPASAPNTTVKATSEGIQFDVRHIPEIVWDRTKIILNEINAREIKITYLEKSRGTVRKYEKLV